MPWIQAPQAEEASGMCVGGLLPPGAWHGWLLLHRSSQSCLLQHQGGCALCFRYGLRCYISLVSLQLYGAVLTLLG